MPTPGYYQSGAIADFGTFLGQPAWNPEFDFNVDGRVSISDIVLGGYWDIASQKNILYPGVQANVTADYFRSNSIYDMTSDGLIRIDDIIVASKIEHYLEKQRVSQAGPAGSVLPGNIDGGSWIGGGFVVPPWYGHVTMLPDYDTIANVALQYVSGNFIGFDGLGYLKKSALLGGSSDNSAYQSVSLGLQRYNWTTLTWDQLPDIGIGVPLSTEQIGRITFALCHWDDGGPSNIVAAPPYALVYRVRGHYVARDAAGGPATEWDCYSIGMCPSSYLLMALRYSPARLNDGNTYDCCFDASRAINIAQQALSSTRDTLIPIAEMAGLAALAAAAAAAAATD
jgi:hypothetical protein